MYRIVSLLVTLLLWANSALAISAPNEPASYFPVASHSHILSDNLPSTVIHSDVTDHPSAYKQVKYSQKLSRYLWLKDKKPKVLSYYNNLSRIVFYHTLPPVNFYNKEIFHVFSVEHDHEGNLRVITQQTWTHNPPDSASRLGGWKESNTLYKGSLTFHSYPSSVI
jgi:hypothetical protein